MIYPKDAPQQEKMMRTSLTIWLIPIGLFVALGAASFIDGQTPSANKVQPPKKPTQPRDIFHLSMAGINPLTGERQRVAAGDLKSAKTYYEELAKQLAFPDGKMPANLNELLQYFGYKALRAADIEELSAEVLMGSREALKHELRRRWSAVPGATLPESSELADASPWKAGEEILSARYFSPKTSDVSGLNGKLSWRRVVRLKPRPASAADKDGLAALYLLSVLYVNDLQQDPFGNRSLSIQVLVVRDAKKRSKLRESTAFMVFDPAANYALTYSTATSWDAADPQLIAKHGVQPYYVPQACVHCHGGDPKNCVPQFFDTDYMLDRSTPGDDFELSLGRSRWGALFDAGREPYTAQFKNGFETFWKLNKEILDSTLQFDKKSEMPSTVGLKNWFRLHGESKVTSALHVPPIKRGFPMGFQDPIKKVPDEEWTESNGVDFQLLPMLSRYCYRCHSGLVYNILDKATVRSYANEIIDRLRSDDPSYWMPQDRRLPAGEKTRFIELLQKM